MKNDSKEFTIEYIKSEKAALDLYHMAKKQDDLDMMLKALGLLDRAHQRRANEDKELMRIGKYALKLIHEKALKETGHTLQ